MQNLAPSPLVLMILAMVMLLPQCEDPPKALSIDEYKALINYWKAMDWPNQGSWPNQVVCWA